MFKPRVKKLDFDFKSKLNGKRFIQLNLQNILVLKLMILPLN